MPNNNKNMGKSKKSAEKNEDHAQQGPHRLQKFADDHDKIKPKRLAKALPDLEERLKSSSNDSVLTGEINQEVKATILCQSDLYQDRNVAIDFVLAHAQVAAPGIGPEVFEVQKQVAVWYQNRTVDYRLANPNPNGHYPWGKTNQERMVNAVERYWDDILRVCFQFNREGMMQHYTTLSQMRLENLWGKVELEYKLRNPERFALMTQQGREVSKKVDVATAAISRGLHESILVCWECGQRSKFDCAACQMAKYCSKKCQVQHWKTVHKPTCKETKEFYALFQEGKNLVRKAFLNPEAHEATYGTEPSRMDIDMYAAFLLPTIMQDLSSASDSNEQVRSKKRPSVRFFYQNVKRVVVDGFWIEPFSLEQEDGSDGQQRSSEERDVFFATLQAMLYDFGDDETLYRDKIKEICCAPGCPYQHVDSFRLTREDWISKYCELSIGKLDPELREENLELLHKSSRLRVFQWFQNTARGGPFVKTSRVQRQLEREQQLQED